MGFACSANLGDEVALFEPSHGSAPKYAEMDPSPVNPTATILAGAMLLDHVGESEMAERVRAAIGAVIQAGTVLTADMRGLPAGPEGFRRGAATTVEFADAVVEELGRLEMVEGEV
jgi:3-isopropylmalate dehydrogenase